MSVLQNSNGAKRVEISSQADIDIVVRITFTQRDIGHDADRHVGGEDGTHAAGDDGITDTDIDMTENRPACWKYGQTCMS